MKNILLVVAFATQISFAQSIFPTDGRNVGIGTINPLSKLEVNGDAKVKGNLFISGLSGGYSTGDNPVLSFGVNSDFAKISIPFGDKMILSSYHGYTFNTSYNGDTALPALTIGITGNVGIGTTNPLSKFEVNGDAKVKENLFITGSSEGYATGDNPVLSFGVNNGFAKINVPFGDKMILSSYHGYTFNTSYNGNIALPALTIGITGDVGICTTNPDSKLAVNGTIHSKEVKVDLTGWPWPDFVFKKEYTLQTLEDVEKHITEKGHLQNIPSEDEVLKNGINLGEMNAKLLQKIEELTLYMIEMKKENKEIKRQSVSIQNENEKIKNENDLMRRNQIKLEKRILKIESK